MLVHIKPLINKSPRRRNPEPKGQNIPRFHRRTLRSVQSQRRVADCALNHLLDSISGVEEPLLTHVLNPKRFKNALFVDLTPPPMASLKARTPHAV